MRLRVSVSLGLALIVGTGFYLLLRRVIQGVEHQYLRGVEEQMVDMAHMLGAQIESEAEDPTLDLSRFEEAFSRLYEREFSAQIYNLSKKAIVSHVYVTDAEGVVVFDSNDGKLVGEDYSQWRDVKLTLEGKYGARSTKADPDDETSSVMFVAAPILDWREEIVGVISVSKPQSSMAVFVQDTQRKIWVSGLVTMVAVTLASLLFFEWLTRPVNRLTDYLRAVKRGERVALPDLGRSEMRTLAEAVEEMRDALEGRQYVEEYVQTLTHEMKSPLAGIRGAAELLHEDMPPEQRDKFLENIRSDVGRSEDIIRRLLLLASLESKKALEEKTDVDVKALLHEVVDAAEVSAARKKLRVVKNFGEEEDVWVVSGDAFTLRVAFDNMLRNAIDFSPEGGELRVGLKNLGEKIRVAFEDEGPGVPDYAMPRVFERFYSLKHSVAEGKKGSGLGLCFVKEVAELHGGSVAVSNLEGGGCRAAFELNRGEAEMG
ncbi:MAG: two-component system sensor histidine kinase CreC [Verrucomicrobiota bacterium]